MVVRRYRHGVKALVGDRRARSLQETNPAAAFLHRLGEKYDVSDTEFLVDAAGYLTALAQRELSGQLDYSERNHIEKCFHTTTMRIDRFQWGQSGEQTPVATAVQTPLQPRSSEPSARWTNTSRGGSQLDSTVKARMFSGGIYIKR